MICFGVYHVSLDLEGFEDIGEDGEPTCNSSSIDNPIRDRRVLIVAVMNCIQSGVKGNSTNVPVIDFMEVFLKLFQGQVFEKILNKELRGEKSQPRL